MSWPPSNEPFASTEVDALQSASVAADSQTSEHEDCDYCPYFQHALELIGRRWTGSILKVLGSQQLRFGEIRTAIPGLSDRLLDTRLTELEDEGIVGRAENSGEVHYSVTAKGIDLQPVFASITTWAMSHPDPESHSQPGRRR